MEKKRSIGVTIVAILLVSYSIWILPRLFHILLTGAFRIPDPVLHLSPTTQFLRFTVDVVFNFLILIGAIGVFLLKSWARKLTLYTASLFALSHLAWGICSSLLFPVFVKQRNLGQGLPDSFFALETFIVGVMPIVCFFAFAVYFFTRPKVKEQFR